jgi:general secretion pathway protein M
MKRWQTLRGHWAALQRRERQALTLMAVVLLACVAWRLAWQPSTAQLAAARESYQAQLLLAAQAHRARPWQAGSAPAGKPLPSQLNESALAAGLRVSRFDIDSDSLRMTLSGESGALLGWLQQTEQQGTRFETLVLEVEGEVLQLGLMAPLQ